MLERMLLMRVWGAVQKSENAMKKRSRGDSLNLVCENEVIDLPLTQ